jgi:hypothetical protein
MREPARPIHVPDDLKAMLGFQPVTAISIVVTHNPNDGSLQVSTTLNQSEWSEYVNNVVRAAVKVIHSEIERDLCKSSPRIPSRKVTVESH